MNFMEEFLTKTFPRAMGKLGFKTLETCGRAIFHELTKKDEEEDKQPPKSTVDLKGISEKMKEAGQTSLDYGGCFFGEINGRAFAKSAEKDGHILVVGGSGSGKSSCFAIPSIIRWIEPIFCIDVKGELYKKAGYLKKNNKVFDPCGITGADPCGYDPFYLLNKARNKAQEAHAMATTLIPLSLDDREPTWIINAQNLLTGAILHYHSLNKSFIDTMKEIVRKPVDELIIDICDNATDEDVESYMSAFIGMAEKQRSGIYSELHRHIILFATDKDIQGCLSSNQTIIPDDLLTEQHQNIYICIPEHLLNQWKRLLSLIITQFLRHFEQLPEKSLCKPFDIPSLTAVETQNRRVLFLIDEFARIGKLDGIENALATLRSKSITICLIIQSLAQLDVIYGEKQRQVIAENCSYKAVFNALDADTQEYFSRIIGTYDKYKQITGRQYEIMTGLPTGRNISTTTEEKRIIKPEEFATLRDVVVLTPEGFFRVDKLPYYKDPAFEWKAQMLQSELKIAGKKIGATINGVPEKAIENFTRNDVVKLFNKRNYDYIVRALLAENNAVRLSEKAFTVIKEGTDKIESSIVRNEVARKYKKAEKARSIQAQNVI